ncbi:Na(+)/H(+) antiporter subunit B1 [Frankliniella fusca]|uniref:Na(+)/H(+) antiporter subunit B1 n=1 Tax=Frankliniella fusca TaxID=407009 RepID=A0AAE1LES0_9NEOP|nr:Na(+)/H(+) antiporter subunit B1 [Frankliniella fusca]
MAREDAALDVPAGAPPAYKNALPRKLEAMLPVVERGCFCCTLRDCNLAQAWLALVGNVVCIPIILYVMAAPNLEREMCAMFDDGKHCQTVQLQLGKDPYTSAISVVLLVYCIVTPIASWLFIKGIRENKPSLMVHYIRTTVASFYAYNVVPIFGLHSVLESLPVVVLLFVLSGYCLVCAHSLRLKMIQALEGPPPDLVDPALGYAYPPPTGPPAYV